MVLGQLDFKYAKLNSDLYLKPYTKNISKWIIDFNVRKKNLCDLGRHKILFFFFCLFRGTLMAYRGSQGSNQSYSCRPTPQPQQCQIPATSVTYSTAQGNARSVTHWAGPRIKPAFSWVLVGFVSTEPQWELPTIIFSCSTTCLFSSQNLYIYIHTLALPLLFRTVLRSSMRGCLLGL